MVVVGWSLLSEERSCLGLLAERSTVCSHWVDWLRWIAESSLLRECQSAEGEFGDLVVDSPLAAELLSESSVFDFEELAHSFSDLLLGAAEAEEHAQRDHKEEDHKLEDATSLVMAPLLFLEPSTSVHSVSVSPMVSTLMSTMVSSCVSAMTSPVLRSSVRSAERWSWDRTWVDCSSWESWSGLAYTSWSRCSLTCWSLSLG